ncbi:conserved Plasmodium protein, unknown function [Plasmodium knowlesi strain H]|uniref:C3H1-type domain-containing protein n=3 Tax=Plasmodium knowlesi TaxID=5850 RepID=A0A5K1V4W2_PLAKH|nr:zinc finger protein, putative [Plasmodium knowlesi strain H]OTN64589.1 Uncharacterized protein PKNOH_S130215400 [Plasmodium knowlesi]CAA9989314.1 zinc finger protein, putative [Plasmodium knowlesi strain H]SBO26111.1 conserved Plasmodium protein, unknown function [Plasmodium knowlesi strain H]SBO26767.1 conserved Plasmodium protein, unknown function [Plasmodium knowlesi strain H]VVS78788.1 zinc finger protein, putative [Plasmodium knowlesi strain H]|eukprot:XP_002261661.1 hypothetical protein, conserved in Plasmodium species [Plasmodium knowlesi strain H]
MSVGGVPVTKSFNKLKKYPYEINKFDRRETNEYFYLPVDCPRMKKCDDAYCPLAHTKLEKIFHPIVYKTQACQMAKDGACDYFQKCAFYHDSNDKNEAHLNWTIWEKKWNKWRNNIDSILTHHNKNDKEIRRKVESILKIRMPHFNYNTNKGSLFLNKNASFYSTWSNSSQGGSGSNGNRMSSLGSGLESGLNNLLCNSINASITHCSTTMFNGPWNTKALSSTKKSVKKSNDNKNGNNNSGSSIWINELGDLGNVNFDKTTNINTSFMSRNNMYCDETLSYNSNTTECGINFDQMDNNAYKVVEFCFTDYENNKTKGCGWRDSYNSDVVNVQARNSFFSHGLKAHDGERNGSCKVATGSGTVGNVGSVGGGVLSGGITVEDSCVGDDSSLFQELTYNKACEYFPCLGEIGNGEDATHQADGMNANLFQKGPRHVENFKEEQIMERDGSPEGKLDLISSKYFSNNSNNTSIFENYGNLSTIFDVSENDNDNNNNKTGSFANLSNCNTFDHLSFDDTGINGRSKCFFTNEHVEEGQGSKVDMEPTDVGSIIRFVDSGASEMVNAIGSQGVISSKEGIEKNGVNKERELKGEEGDKNANVTLTGSNTKGQNKMSKKNKNKKGVDANLGHNNSTNNNSSNVLNGRRNTRASTFCEVLCTGNVELRSELSEKRKNTKKDNLVSKNCKNEKDQEDRKNGNNKFVNGEERNDENFSGVDPSCGEREKEKNGKAKNGECQGGKKSNNTASMNKGGNKNCKKGTTESGSNGGTPRNRKAIQGDQGESDQTGSTDQEKGQLEQISGKEVEVGNHGEEHAFRDKTRKNGNANEKGRNSGVNGRDVIAKGSNICSGVNSMNQAKVTCEEVKVVVGTNSRSNFDWANRNQDEEKKKQNNDGTVFNSVGSVQNRGRSIDIYNSTNLNHGVVEKFSSESTLNNGNPVEDKKQVEKSCCQTMNYCNCRENSVVPKESSEYAILKKEFMEQGGSMFYNYAKGSMDSKLGGFGTSGGRDNVGVVGGIGEMGDLLFGRKRNNSAFILKQGEDHSSMSLQGGSDKMGDDGGSIFNLSPNMPSSFNQSRCSSFSVSRGSPFSRSNVSNDAYSNFFIKEETLHPMENNQFEDINKSKEYNSNEKEENESMDYTNNLLNIFLSCNSINENFECTNEGDNSFTNFKEDTNLFGYKEKEVTNGSELFNYSSSSNFNPFGNYNFLGPSCLQCKHYKNEIKNLMAQIKVLREELSKCKQIIMSSGFSGGNDDKVNPCNYNWTNRKSFSDIYEKKNFVSSIEGND